MNKNIFLIWTLLWFKKTFFMFHASHDDLCTNQPSEPLQTVATAVTFSTTPNYTKKICMTHDISFCFFLGSYFHPGLNAPKKSLNRAVLHTSTSCLLCTTLFRVFENHRKYLIVKYLDFQAKNTNISKVSTIVQCTCMITVQCTL